MLKVLLVKEDKDGISKFSVERLYPAIDPISGKFSDLIELQLKLAEQEFHEAESVYNTNTVLNLGLVAGGVAVGLLMAFWIVRSITRPLEGMRSVAMAVAASSDFSRRVKVDSEDDVGQTARAFNQLMQTQQEAIDAVNRTVLAMASGDLRQRVTAEGRGEKPPMSAEQLEKLFLALA